MNKRSILILGIIVISLLWSGAKAQQGSSDDWRGPVDGVEIQMPTAMAPVPLPGPGQKTPLMYGPGGAEALLNAIRRAQMPEGQERLLQFQPQQNTIDGSPPAAPPLGANFTGPGFGGIWTPGDPVIAAGSTYVGVMINSQCDFYTKAGVWSGGSVLKVFFAPVYDSLNCRDPFDVKIIFDHHANKWVMLALTYCSASQKSYYLVAVSQTINPLGLWWLWALDVMDPLEPNPLWADYPGLGFDADSGVYITSNQYAFGGGFNYAKIRALRKGALYSGTAIWWDYWGMIDFDGSTTFTIKPAHTFGNPGVEYLVNSKWAGGNTVDLWSLLPGDPFPANLGPVGIGWYFPPPIPPCSDSALNLFDCRTQDAQYRNNHLYTSFHEEWDWGSGVKAVVRFLKIDIPLMAAAIDERYGHPDYHYFFPSIYSSPNDNIVTVFNRCGYAEIQEFISARYSARFLTQGDVASRASLYLQAGQAWYGDWVNPNRWGDYSGIAYDPFQFCTMWIYSMYAMAPYPPLANWGTWIGSVFTHPLDTLQNHFKTWRVEPEPFSEIVFVEDQFMSDDLVLDQIEFFSNPVRKDSFEIVDSLEHLTWYRAQGRDTLLEVEYQNQFGIDTVNIDSVKYLLLPTAKEDYPFAESLDHYKAYRIKDPVAFDRVLELEDQFDLLFGEPEFIDSLKPVYFLTPAIKNMEQPEMFDSITHYVAYEIFPERFFPLPVNTLDQFGPHVLQVDTSKILLVPTMKLRAEPPPPPDTLRNHYKTWWIMPQTFGGTVFVQDQFMEDSLELTSLEFISNPVTKVVDSDTFDIIRPDDHLTWYSASGRDTLIQVEYVNQFESTTVVIDMVEWLLVPTQKEGHAPPVNLDHYKAYNIQNPVEFPVQLSLEDQFDVLYGSPEFIEYLWPRYFLAPAIKNMEQPQLFDSVTHYVAYEMLPTRYFPLSVYTWDQFGEHVLDVQESMWLLVPSTKRIVPPCDPPNINCPADETQNQNGVYTTTTQWTADDGNPADPTVELISVAVQPPLPPGISAANVNFIGPVPGPGLGVKATWGTVTYTVSDHCQPGGSITLIATNNCPPPNNSATCTFNVTLTNDPPDITQPDSLEGLVNDVVQYDITGTDPNGDVINDTASITIEPDCGTYSITRTAGHGTSSGTWQVTWNTDGCTACITHLVIHDLTDTCGATSYCTTKVHLTTEEEWPNHKMHFPQLPDLEGWDVYAVLPKTLADDWQCSRTGPVLDIHFWGSWKDVDGDPYTDDFPPGGEMPWFQLSIHRNIPATPDTPWSRPGELVWWWEGEIPGTPFEPPAMEHWFNPNTGEVLYNDHVPYWRYDFFFDQAVPPPELFFQYKDSIYWLNVSAVGIPPPYEWGWKSSRDHFMDDATYTDNPPDGPWFPLYEPPRANWFDVYFNSAGDPEDMGSTNYYGAGWYRYEYWWNMWFYNNPFVPNPKHIWLEFNVDPVGPDAYVEFAINWSTDLWYYEGEPGRPPLPGDDETLYIGRQTFPVDFGPNTIDFWIEDYNPEWVSIDFVATDVVINGWIWHECVQTSMDLAFVITGEERNHYKTWRIEPQTFDSTVFVQDQFMEDSLSLFSLEYISNPVKKVVENDTFDIIRSDDHLTWYRAFGRDTSIQVGYVNQFESTTVVIDLVEFLLVPTQKEPHDPPENLDHYKAYRIEDGVEFPVMLYLEDQFDIEYGEPEFIEALRPIYFLTPALKNMEQPQMFDSVTHYVAYEILPKRIFSLPANTWDQFGPHVLDVLESEMLLVPSEKLKVCLPPTIGCPADETQDQNGVYTTTTQWTADDGNPADPSVELISVAVQPPLPPGISAANVNFLGPVPGPGLGVKSTWGTVTYTVSDHCQPGGSITLIATNNCPPPNNSATCTFNVTLTNDPPDITQPDFLEGFVDDTVQYEITGTDPNGDVINDTASITIVPDCGTYSITRTAGHGTSSGTWQVTWETDGCTPCDTHMVIHDLTDTCGATSYCTTWVHLSEERECDPNDPYDCDTLWVECGNMRVPPGGGLVKVELTVANDETLTSIVVPLSYQGNPACCDSMIESENTVAKVFAGSIVEDWDIKVVGIDHQAKKVLLAAVPIVPPDQNLPPGKGHFATLTFFGDSCCTILLDTTLVLPNNHVSFGDTSATLFYPVCRIDTCHIERNNPPIIEQPDFLEGYVDSVVEYTIDGTDPDGDVIEDDASIDIQPGCGSGYSITRVSGHGTSTGTWQITWYTDGCTPCDTHMVIHDLTDVLGATAYCTTWVHLSEPESLYWKPPYEDYAPNGMVDIDQKQDGWRKVETEQWSFCGPCAVANCFKWFDSKYNVPPGAPGDGIDMFPLVRDYLDNNPPLVGFDDHDPWNVDHIATPWNPGIGPPPPTPQPFVPGPQPPNQVPSWGELVERLAWYFDTDGIRTEYCSHTGTNVDSMQAGIDAWLRSETFPDGSSLADTLCEVTTKAPTFAYVESLVEKCEDVILLLGFWWPDTAGEWRRIGGHYVTVAGVNSETYRIAFSDPFIDAAEFGAPGRVGDGTLIPHSFPHDPTVHNDEGNVSHDIYTADTASISPGGVWWLPDYAIIGDPGYWSWNFYAQNVPDEFIGVTAPWDGISEIHTEVEYCVHISPWHYRGDCNQDGIIDIGDVVCMINYLFTGTTPPDPLSEIDTNCDGIVDIGDVITLINYLFTGTAAPRCCDP